MPAHSRHGRMALGLSATLTFAACGGGSSSPTAPTAAGTAAPLASFAIELPIAPGDGATFAYGIWPYGVHGSSHGVDGHPGFDIEYRIGAPVLAATDGVVNSITADA